MPEKIEFISSGYRVIFFYIDSHIDSMEKAVNDVISSLVRIYMLFTGWEVNSILTVNNGTYNSK